MPVPASAAGAEGVADSMGNMWAVSSPASGTVTVTPGALSPSPRRAAVEVQPPAGWEPGEARLACDDAGYMWLTDGSLVWRADPRTGGALAFGTADKPTIWEDGFRPPGPVAHPGWIPGPRLPFGNHDIHACECGGKVYVSGGLAPGGFPAEYRVFNELLAWDGESLEWELVSHMPGRRTFNGLASLEGEVWVCGGADGAEGDTGTPDDRIPCADCFIWNPSEGCWRDGPPLNVARIECLTLW
jgi:hypothetical protein